MDIGDAHNKAFEKPPFAACQKVENVTVFSHRGKHVVELEKEVIDWCLVVVVEASFQVSR